MFTLCAKEIIRCVYSLISVDWPIWRQKSLGLPIETTQSHWLSFCTVRKKLFVAWKSSSRRLPSTN